jgi:hypothetical protein
MSWVMDSYHQLILHLYSVGDILYASDEMSRVMDSYHQLIVLGKTTR